MVGGMGHSSSVSLGYSIKNENKVFCLDGDGSMLMHLGALATCAQIGNKNFKYILLNNYCHNRLDLNQQYQKKINFELLSKSLRFKNYTKITKTSELDKKLNSFLKKKDQIFLR